MSDVHVDLREHASFLRAGIALGLLSARDAIAWADELLAGATALPPEVMELALTPPDQDVRVRELLGDLAFTTFGEAESPAVVAALLDVLRTDRLTGRCSLAGTIAVLVHVGQALPLAHDLELALRRLAIDGGAAAPAPDLVAHIDRLLAPFADARLRFPARAA